MNSLPYLFIFQGLGLCEHAAAVASEVLGLGDTIILNQKPDDLMPNSLSHIIDYSLRRPQFKCA